MGKPTIKRIIVVPHTHWDREWHTPFEQFRWQLVRAFDTLIQTLEQEPQHPGFLLDGQTAVFDDYLDLRPAMRERLLTLTRAGRISVGPWYVLPDEFLVSQESLIRNLLRGLQDARQWGAPLLVGYLPDMFGHVGQMPQLLRSAGIDTAVVWRGVPPQLASTEFWWQSPDGSRVLASYLVESYGIGQQLPLDGEGLRHRVEQIATSLQPWQASNIALLPNGFDHQGIQPGLASAIHALPSNDAGARVETGLLTDYLSAVRAELGERLVDLPLHIGELRHPQRAPILPNVASTRTPFKVRDFRATNLMERVVEPLAAWLTLLGEAHEPTAHRRIWTLLLQNQPHDSISGCNVDQVQQDVAARFASAEQLMASLIADYWAALSHHLPRASGDGLAQIVTFNPLAPRAEEVCVADLTTPQPLISPLLRDEQGRPVHCQLVPQEGRVLTSFNVPIAYAKMIMGMAGNTTVAMGRHVQRVDWGLAAPDNASVTVLLGDQPSPTFTMPATVAQGRAFLEANQQVKRVSGYVTLGYDYRLYFPQREVGSGAVRRYSLSDGGRPPASDLLASPQGLENQHYRLTIGKDGFLYLLDKRDGRQHGPLNAFSDGGEKGDTYNYCPPPLDSVVAHPQRQRASRLSFMRVPVRVTVTATGPLFAEWKLIYRYSVPAGLSEERGSRSKKRVSLRIESRVRLYAGSERIDFETTIHNRARDHRLRVTFHTPIKSDVVYSDGHFELVSRPYRDPEAGDIAWVELPQPTRPVNAFAALSDARASFLLIPQGLREVEATATAGGSTLHLTLLRAVGHLSRSDLETRPSAAGPELVTPAAQMIGTHHFSYSLLLVPQPLAQAALWGRVAACHNPSLAYASSGGAAGAVADWPAAGLLPLADEIEWSALKPAEDGDGVILRLVNKRDRPLTISLPLPPLWRDCHFYAANVLEEVVGDLLPLSDGVLTLHFGPAQIRTLRLRRTVNALEEH